MFRLTLTLSGEVVDRFEFDQDRVVIGRGQEADARIDNLGVSRQHAEIRREGAVYQIVDLRSNNGTYIDGRRINAHNLNDGDEITIGKFVLVFTAPQMDAELAVPDEDPNLQGSGQTMIMDDSLGLMQQRGKATRVKGYLLLPKRGERRDSYFLDKSICVVGSSKKAHIRVGGWFVKAKHSVIFRDDLGYLLLAIGKTRVNGERVDEKRLEDGDLIAIGGNDFQFMVGRPVY